MSGGPLSYEPFFGLKKKPFSLASDPEFLYESPSHSAALLALLAGMRRREGLLAFTGDVGTGKTTICRAVLRNLDRTTFSAFIPDPFASREDLLRMLLIEFGVASVQDLTTGPLARAGRAQLSYLLSSFLDTLVPLEAFVVVFIDEAQNMSLSLLEEVRVLSDAFHRHGQLQVVLVGQLELIDKLKSSSMRQVDQRVSVYTRLEPLNAEDVIGYVQHRLQIAGASPNMPMFAPRALGLLHETSEGIPRVINRICDRALHLAYERRSPLIDYELMAAAVEHAPPARPSAYLALPSGGEDIAALLQTPPAPREANTDAATVRPDSRATFAHRVDAWLADLDGQRPAAAVEHDAPPAPAPDPLPEVTENEGPRAPIPFEPPLRRFRSERYMGRLARHWARVGVRVLVAFVGLNAVVAAASYVPARLNTQVQRHDLPPLPAAPALRLRSIATPGAAPASADVVPAKAQRPSAGDAYAVAVGAYSSTARAEQLAELLVAQGFAAFTHPLTLRTRVLYQVSLGPYESGADADAALQRLREAGDYGDARVITLSPANTQAP